MSLQASFSLSWETISCPSKTGKVYQVNISLCNLQIGNAGQEPFRVRDPKLMKEEEMARKHTSTYIQ